MKYFSLPLLVFFNLLCFSYQGQNITTNDSADIFLVFKKYDDAVRNGNGTEASNYISQISFNYYDTLIYHVLYSNERDLQNMNLLAKTKILRIRHTHPVNFWDNMTGKKLLIQTVSNPKMNSVCCSVALDGCEIKEFTAICGLKMFNIRTPAKLAFNKENNIWKVDITSGDSEAIAAMQQEMLLLKLSETKYILYKIKSLDKKKIKKRKLYTPVRSK